ncbi:divergent polysaccharide deacetylase family protein [Candidatus Liberibacter africanus]|uniref:Divergent polysaccharide deacetylase family protein n=1 Tax=Candidatus Liberibacter africanus PTSAPSY TaxID=1277257 RepID=A0A0G3I4Y9_LIBAF|nr:divergent polysaccharide deacetylase family protein [Candidatus Liberibacter africanus]AKK20345.1 hypothetical protein G293_03585 [Candidatus Liberibacter africanus PTSAPSY]
MFFCTFIIGFSIYIFVSNHFVDMAEVSPYSVIRDIIPISSKNSLEIDDKKDNIPVNDQVKIDLLDTTIPDKKIPDKKIVDKPKRSTLLDSLPTIEERLLPSVPIDASATNKMGNKESKGSIRDTRVCPDISGARIAIVVSGLGISQTGTQRAINLLPSNVTLAFASNGNSLNRWMTEAKKKGQEAILQIPMQAFNEADNADDVYTLKVTQTPQQLLDRLRYSLNRGMDYFGIMNYRGAMLLSHKDSVEVMFKEFSKRGLLFFDDGSSGRSLTRVLASKFNLPYMVADLYLDDQIDRDKIGQKLKELEEIARTSGQAIGVAVAFDESIEVISQWLQQKYGSDISVVPLSCLVKSSRPSS